MTGMLFFKGLIIGFSTAAPIGPMCMLCINRTLVRGMAFGLATGMGVAVADSIYGLIGAAGITIVAGALIHQQTMLQIIGGLYLCWIGWQAWHKSNVLVNGNTNNSRGLAQAFFSAVGLTLTNPMTIMAYVAICISLDIGSGDALLSDIIAVVLGVFAGSALWWILVSAITAVIRKRMDDRFISWVNRISAVIITIFGLIALNRALNL